MVAAQFFAVNQALGVLADVIGKDGAHDSEQHRQLGAELPRRRYDTCHRPLWLWQALLPISASDRYAWLVRKSVADMPSSARP
jgi:hypothetical protein